MRTIIFGANGQLGRDLLRVFQAVGEVTGFDLPEVDITDGPAVSRLLDGPAPDLVINAAAYTDVDGAEDDFETAFLVNETGARNVAETAARMNIPVVYYSTDYVFDGTSDHPYTPEDSIHPLSVYGRSKASGEAATRQSNPRAFILRTAWLYGPGGNNFVEKILRAAAAKPTLNVVTGETGCPTHTWDLAEATLVLTLTHAYGLYHVVNQGSCSRFEQAQEIIRLAGLNTPIIPCAAATSPAKAARPRFSVLDSEKYTRLAGQPMRSWQEALRHYIRRRETTV